MKIAGIVVAYYPDMEELERNIASYLDDLEMLMIWENTPRKDSRLQDYFGCHPKIQIRTTGQNEGIARALNEGAEWAIRNDCSHLLTMDQDASFREGQFSLFVALVEKERYPSAGMYIPNRNNSDESLPVREVETAITSGCLIPVSLFSDIGFFMTELFIDMVDHEYCIRARLKGYKIFEFRQICMNHRLGDRNRSKLGYKVNNYPPLRTYYIIRNWHIVRKMYPDSFLNTGRERRKFSRKYGWQRFFKIIFFEHHKSAKLKAFFLGYYHAGIGKTGKVYS